jgi:hypothetical protein
VKKFKSHVIFVVLAIFLALQASAQETSYQGRTISVWEKYTHIKAELLGLLGFVRARKLTRIEFIDTDNDGKADVAEVTRSYQCKGQSLTAVEYVPLNNRPDLLRHIEKKAAKRPRKAANISRGAPPRSASFFLQNKKLFYKNRN